jgi:hypothetical protein
MKSIVRLVVRKENYGSITELNLDRVLCYSLVGKQKDPVHLSLGGDIKIVLFVIQQKKCPRLIFPGIKV